MVCIVANGLICCQIFCCNFSFFKASTTVTFLSNKLLSFCPSLHYSQNLSSNDMGTWLNQETPKDSGAYGGADHPGGVAGHGRHQEKIVRIRFEAHHIDLTGGAGNGGHTGRPQEWIDFLLHEQVHDLSEEHPGGRGEAESDRAQEEDAHRFSG
jgi:hypothetical protein